MHTLDVNGYHIDRKSISKDKYESIKAQLTVKPYVMDGKDNKDRRFKLYKKTKKYITVPKYFGIKEFGTKYRNDLNKTKVDLEFKGSLRDYQIDIVSTCRKYIDRHMGGLLSIGCGRGKTVIALKLAADLGLKTLVVVHKNFLIAQWLERIEQFTNASTGIIKRDKCDVDGRHIVVGLIQSISKRDYGDIFKDFGFVIFDEAHHAPAKFFSKTLRKTCAMYTLALSATPYRSDGLIKVLHWYMGDTIYRENPKPNSALTVKTILYRSKDSNFMEKKKWHAGKYRVHIPITLNEILEIKSRNMMICSILQSLIQDRNRKILVLSGRKIQLKKIKKYVDTLIRDDIKSGKIDEDSYNSYYYIGDMNDNERKEAETYGDIFFGTYEMAHEALDIPKLNTIVLITPKKNIVQAVGRIQRKILSPGDLRPLVVDIVDDLPIFVSHGKHRANFYKNSCYCIENYECSDGNFGEKCIDDIMKLRKVNEEDLIPIKTSGSIFSRRI